MTGALPWTEKESAKLTKLLQEKVSYREIAKILGKSRSACEGHAFRIGATQSLKITDEEALDPVILTSRKCLNCLLQFDSLGPQNRLCRKCKKNMGRLIT